MRRNLWRRLLCGMEDFMDNKLAILVRNRNGEILAEYSGINALTLVYPGVYEEGDEIVVRTEQTGVRVYLRIDDAINEAFCYLTENEYIFRIPFGEKRTSYSRRAFAGETHLSGARMARDEETDAYRKLARNEADQHEHYGCYPHASANAETRGEAVFAARNAIDGMTENHSHGPWPYESWGINMRDDAQIKVEFGRTVETDRIVLYTRADFPHDNYWTSGTFRFSDGSVLVMQLEKTDQPQEIVFPVKKIEWLTLDELIKGDSPSPYPALIEIEVWGRG